MRHVTNTWLFEGKISEYIKITRIPKSRWREGRENKTQKQPANSVSELRKNNGRVGTLDWKKRKEKRRPLSSGTNDAVEVHGVSEVPAGLVMPAARN